MISPKPSYGESEGRTATKAFRKRDLPTDQAKAQQPEWDVLQWGCSGFLNPSTARWGCCLAYSLLFSAFLRTK